MTDLIGLRSALFSTARARAVSIRLGVAAAISVQAVRYDAAAEAAFGASTFRRVQFEVRAADLPATPAKGDTITEAGRQWAIIEIENRPETGTVLLSVEG